MRIFIFALFASVTIAVGVTTVCLTSPKPSTSCDMTFRRIGKSSLSLSSQPCSLAVGNFNKDNRIDIVVANSGTNTIGILLADANGTFAHQEIYSIGLGSRPCSVITNDFNDDNNSDIAIANYGTNSLSIFFGYGNGTFGRQKVLSTGSSRPLFIISGDVNNDFRSDIIVANNGTTNIGIFLGNGDGSYQAQLTHSTGYDSIPYSLAVGDFNQDNQLDIAVANYGTNNIGIFLGYGNGAFASQKMYTTTHDSHPSSIAVGDFNSDKQLDIVVANYGTGNIGILLGRGDGTFVAQTTYSIAPKSRPQFIATGYFDKNNHLDVVAVDAENEQVHILPGYGNGSFASLTTYDSVSGSRPVSVAVADFDKNNQSDIAVGNFGTNNILVLIGYYSKPSARQQTYFVGRDSRPSSLLLYDFNNDRKLDIAVNNFNDNYILILNGVDDGTFIKGQMYSTGDRSASQYLCTGDLNKDNRMDIVVANLGSSNIGVLFGRDNGTFATIVTFSTGIDSTPWFVAFGDVNNDTHLDLISANTGSGNIGIFLGRGNGTFADMMTYSTGTPSSPISLAVGDVNNDYHLDIVVSIEDPKNVSVFLGHGNGSFDIVATYSFGTNSQTFWVALVDFNRDTYLDIAVVDANAGISILLGNGDGTFRIRMTYSTGSGVLPYVFAVADFNHDHYEDLAVTNGGSNEVAILFGDGNGNFDLGRTYSTGFGSGPYGIVVADLNNDKQLEFVVAYWGTGEVGVLTEYNAANFTNQMAVPTGSAPRPYSIAVGDFNNDNRSDIVVANSGTDDLGILLGLGDGSFGAKKIYSIATNADPQYVITVDIDKDKYLDIVAVNSLIDSISVIKGYGNGSFTAQTIYSTGDGSRPYAVNVGDLNNDDRLDLIVTNSGTDSIGIFFGYNYASFLDQKTYSNEESSTPMAVGVNYFNNDTYLDIVTIFSSSNSLGILLGHGDESFSTLITYSTGSNSHPKNLVVDDFNNDGRMDVAVANHGADNVGLFFGDGHGGFAAMVRYSTGDASAPRFLAVGDFNNDNRTDIVSVNSGRNSIGIFIAYANGSFASMITFSTADFSFPFAAAVGHFNNDSQLDIVVIDYGTNNVRIFLGYGNGSFSISVTYSTGYQSRPYWVVVGDFNSDNQSDIATANYNNNNVGILLGYGNGSFATVVGYVTRDNSSPQCISVGDFNNDHILDIAVANFYSDDVVVLFGFRDGTFLLSRAYAAGQGSGPFALATGDFDHNGRLDIVVANSQSNTIGVFLGYGIEPFAGITKYKTGDGSQPHSVAVNDVNSDGCLDIVVTNYGTDSIGIFLGYGNGFFSTMLNYSTGTGSAPYSVAISDFNNDNCSDIAVTNSEANSVAIFLGDRNGTFSIVGVYLTGVRSRPYTIVIGDLNNDNQSDLIITNSGTNTILLLYGYGNGSFGHQTSSILNYNYHPYSVAVTYLNQDNWMDIVIACYGTDNIETLIKMC